MQWIHDYLIWLAGVIVLGISWVFKEINSGQRRMDMLQHELQSIRQSRQEDREALAELREGIRSDMSDLRDSMRRIEAMHLGALNGRKN